MRYFVRCRYNGTRYHGWQIQPHGTRTIQGEIEDILTKLFGQHTGVYGCGRTDTGVHAADYVFHFDGPEDVSHVLYKLNRMSSADLAFDSIHHVNDEAHARFDAISRSYRYHVVSHKDPFHTETTYYYPAIRSCGISLLQQAAALLLNYKDFTAFCKEGSEVVVKECTITESRWDINGDAYTYHITANRFLRGMIRLIVGMCINVAQGKLELSEVEEALQNKRRLARDLSVPGSGLFLDRIVYPESVTKA